MAEALYRKYRPQVFEDVVGQEPIERTLKNAIAQNKVSHAYLFCGPRGTGKTTTARLLAKALLCQNGPTPDPDGTCEECQLIAEGTHPDVYELDAASRTGVENVREEIIGRVQFAPTRGTRKVYIIDEVHMLSIAAFNALLKTLEEPPSHVIFILCTTDPQKVPETIHSRCQRFDFRRIAPESMVSRLGAICIAEGVEFEGEALDLIAHRAEGGLRNALTSLEQIIAFENGKVTLAGAERLLGSIDSNDLAEIMAYVGKRDIANCFRWTSRYVETGADLAQFVRDMAEHVRNLYVMGLVGDEADLDVSETARRELAGELQWFGPDRSSRLLGVLGDLAAELKTSSNPRLSFEIALTRMVRPDSDLTLEALAERIEALESGYSAVAHVLPGQPMMNAADTASSYEPAVQAVAEMYEPAQPQSTQVPTAAPAEQPVRTAAPVAEAAQTAQAGQANARNTVQAGTAATGAEQAAARAVETEATAATQMSASQTAVSTPAASTAGGSTLAALENPAAVQRIWQAAMAALKKHKQAHVVLFMSAKPRFDAAAGTLRIVFPAESDFLFKNAQKPDVQDALAAALQKSAGAPVPFSFEKAGGGASTAVRTEPQAARAADPAPAQQAASAQQTASAQQATAAQQQVANPASAQQAAVTQQQATTAATTQQAGFTGNPVSQSAASPEAAAMAQATNVTTATQPTTSQPEAASQPTGTPQSATMAQPAAFQSAAAPQTNPVAAPQPGPAPQRTTVATPQPDPFDQPPYEQVPYDDLPYDPVPYDEFDIAPAPARNAAPAANEAPTSGANTGFSPNTASSSQPFPAEQTASAVEAAPATGSAPAGGSAPAAESVPASAIAPTPEAAAADESTNASPVAPNLTPDGTPADDTADVQAILQAGFGEGIVFSEVDE